jgi:hypothetical protein
MLRASLRGLSVPGWSVSSKKPGRMVCLRLSFASGRKWQHNSRLPLGFKSSKLQTYQPLNLWCSLAHDRMAKKSKPEIKPGATVRLRAQSGEIVEGRACTWGKKICVGGSGCVRPTGLQRSGEYAGR